MSVEQFFEFLKNRRFQFSGGKIKIKETSVPVPLKTSRTEVFMKDLAVSSLAGSFDLLTHFASRSYKPKLGT